MGKFKAVTEGPTSGENRIPEAQRADLDAQVCGTRNAHFEQCNTRERSREGRILGDSLSVERLAPMALISARKSGSLSGPR